MEGEKINPRRGSCWNWVLLWDELSVHHGASLQIHKPLQSWDTFLNPVTGSPALKAWWDLNEGKPVYNMLPFPSPQVEAQWGDCLSSHRPFLGPIIPLLMYSKRVCGHFLSTPCPYDVSMHASTWVDFGKGWGGGFCRQHAGSLFSAAGRFTKPHTPHPPSRGDGVTHGRASEKELALLPFLPPAKTI